MCKCSCLIKFPNAARITEKAATAIGCRFFCYLSKWLTAHLQLGLNPFFIQYMLYS